MPQSHLDGDFLLQLLFAVLGLQGFLRDDLACEDSFVLAHSSQFEARCKGAFAQLFAFDVLDHSSICRMLFDNYTCLRLDLDLDVGKDPG